MLGAPSCPLRLELIELRLLFGREDGDELRLLLLAELLELRALRLHRGLQGVHLGGVVGLPGRTKLLARGAGLLEEGLVRLEEGLVVRLGLRLLRVREVELLGEMHGHPVPVMSAAPTVAVAFALCLCRGDGERTAQRDRCYCGNHFVRLAHDVFLLESWLTGGIESWIWAGSRRRSSGSAAGSVWVGRPGGSCAFCFSSPSDSSSPLPFTLCWISREIGSSKPRSLGDEAGRDLCGHRSREWAACDSSTSSSSTWPSWRPDS